MIYIQHPAQIRTSGKGVINIIFITIWYFLIIVTYRDSSEELKLWVEGHFARIILQELLHCLQVGLRILKVTCKLVFYSSRRQMVS